MIASGQLSIEDALQEREAELEGFVGWSVFQDPPARRWFTTEELARRWRTTEARTLDFLEGFEQAGFAVRRGDYWRASDLAVGLLHLIDRDGLPL